MMPAKDADAYLVKLSLDKRATLEKAHLMKLDEFDFRLDASRGAIFGLADTFPVCCGVWSIAELREKTQE